MKLTPANIQTARCHLRDADPVMKTIIDAVGPYTLRFERDRFAMLVRSIVSQQISTGAARAIRTRLQALAGPEGLTAQNLSRFRMEELRLNSSPQTERKAAEFVESHLRGVRPQAIPESLQWLGLSRYEVPIDSRLTKWLNRFGFPVKLNAFCLADPVYYNFVSDGFQRLCEASDIVPCVLDAAIFASFDGDEWTDENV